MNHRALIDHWSLQHYRNRDYQWAHVDNATFELLNSDNDGFMLYFTGCLDALEYMPAGSFLSERIGRRWAGSPSCTVRGFTQAEIDEQYATITAFLKELP